MKFQHQHINNLKSQELIKLGQGEELPQSPRVVLDTFTQYAKSHPNVVALESSANRVTYGELDQWSHNIALQLLALEVKSGEHIAVAIPPSPSTIAAILAILKIGCAYVPLDADLPEKHLNTLLEASHSTAILVNTKCDISFTHSLKLPILTIDVQTLSQFQTAANAPISLSVNPVNINSTAYIIFTSGSTGAPKGTVISHKSLAVSTNARNFIYGTKHKFLLLSPISCDSSVAGIFSTLTTGGTLFIATYNETRDPEQIIALIQKNKITHFLCIPSLYRAILTVIAAQSIKLSTLQTVIVAGDNLHPSLLKEHFVLHDHSVKLINEYGPTEGTVWCSYQIFTNPTTSVSIGKPIPGIQLYVLNKHLQLVDKGEEGELFIAGDQVAQGYWNQPDLSQQFFIVNPFVNSPNTLMYKTGDLVKWNDDNTLQFIGRVDHQVKIRGRRVNLIVVEKALASFDGVDEAVVIQTSDKNSLIAFVTLSDAAVSIEQLRQQLASELPSFMQPQKIRIVEKFITTRSGKIDRNALQEDIEKTTILTNASHDNVKSSVVTSWCEVLKTQSVPNDANFFDLGGHSLMIFELQAALQKHTQCSVPIVELFRHTTVNSQTELINNKLSKD